MKSKSVLSKSSIILGSYTVVFFVMIIFFLNTMERISDQNLQQQLIANQMKLEVIPNNVPKEVSQSNIPTRIKIPKIQVDAAIKQAGLTDQGEMGVPKGPEDTTWFALGPRPGEKGNAVIAGHDGWKDGMSAVFDNLHMLTKGDKVYIEDEVGSTSTFVVQEIRTYDNQSDSLDVFHASDEESHLNLITCEGIWNKKLNSYSNRLVVFADKQRE